MQVQKPASVQATFFQGAQGYALGQVVKSDITACQGLLSHLNSVLVSPQADELLQARGNVLSAGAITAAG
jgi:hypothetical protein